MNNKALLAAIMLLAAGGTSASASTVTLSYEDSNDALGGVYADLRVRYDSDWRGRDKYFDVEAGGFHMQDQSGNSLIAWCLDLFGILKDDLTYEITDSPFSGQEIDSIRLNNIQSLFDMNYSSVDLTSGSEVGGFQLALWELLYEDGDTFNVDGDKYSERGNFYAKSYGSDDEAIEKANKYLSKVGTDDTDQAYQLTYYDADAQSASNDHHHGNWFWIWNKPKVNYQDLVSGTEIPDSNIPEVPLPATAWLLGGGLAALFGVGRRTKNAKS